MRVNWLLCAFHCRNIAMSNSVSLLIGVPLNPMSIYICKGIWQVATEHLFVSKFIFYSNKSLIFIRSRKTCPERYKERINCFTVEEKGHWDQGRRTQIWWAWQLQGLNEDDCIADSSLKRTARDGPKLPGKFHIVLSKYCWGGRLSEANSFNCYELCPAEAKLIVKKQCVYFPL